MKVTNAAVLTEEKVPEEAQRLVASGENGSKHNPWTQLWHVAGLCCSAKFDAETMNRPLAERRILGDATDQATLRFAETLGPVDSLLSTWKQVMEVPFNSKNKVFSLAISLISSLCYESLRRRIWKLQKKLCREMKCQNSLPLIVYVLLALLIIVVMFIKGAPDVLLPRCTSVVLPSGERVPLTPSLLDELNSLQYRWSTAAQRVLLLTRRVISFADVDVKELGSPESTEAILREFTNELVVVGMIGIVDPPRADIPEVVNICRGGGIRFFMV